jgi:hypothetical protein
MAITRVIVAAGEDGGVGSLQNRASELLNRASELLR